MIAPLIGTLYTIRRKMEIFKPTRLSSLDSLVQLLDSLRVFLIRLSLRPHLFRQLYLKSHLRLSTGMILSTIFYLPFAILKPHLLLALGPLIFGYPHLVASYRFTAFKKYGLYIFATLIAIILHVSKIGFFHIEQLPFGVWQIVVAAGALIVSGQVRVKGILLCLLLTSLLINLAWQEPIIYVGDRKSVV